MEKHVSFLFCFFVVFFFFLGGGGGGGLHFYSSLTESASKVGETTDSADKIVE